MTRAITPRLRAVLVLIPIILLLLGASRRIPAVSADGSASEWQVRGTWDVHANADDVRALARDGDVLWAATRGGGVVRWNADGSSARQLLAPRDGLPCNDVRDVLRWRGTWFFATCDGLATWMPGEERMASVTVGLPSPSLTALAVDAQDRLWVASEPVWDAGLRLPGRETAGGWHGGGVAVTEDGGHFVRYGLAEGLSSLDVRDIEAWRDELWLASRPFRAWREPGEDPDGNQVPGRWEPTGGGVARLDGQRWTAMGGEQSSNLSDDARALAPGADVLWLATGGRGLAAWNGASWSGLRDCGNESRCIQDNYVTAVAEGPDGAVWVATERFNGQGTGVAVLDPRGTPTDEADDAWFVLRGASAPPGDLVHAILPDTDAGVWFGAAARDPEGLLHGRGLARLLDDRQTLVPLHHATTGAGAPPGNDMTAVLRHPGTGSLWVGTARDGLGELQSNGTWRHHSHGSTGGGLGSNSIADLEVGPDGSLWVATRQITYDAERRTWTDGGLSRYLDGAWRRFTTADGLPSNHLSALALDGRGTLWVGTGATDRGPKEHAYRGSGLAALDARTGAWARTYTTPQLASNNVTDLHVRDGRLWVSTAYFFYVDTRPGGVRMTTGGGVSVLDIAAGTWRGFTSEDGLSPALRGRDGRPLLDLRAIHAGSAGGAWTGGLAYPDGRFDPDRDPGGIIEGVDGIEGEGVRLPDAGPVTDLVEDSDGLLWAGTAGDGARVRVPDGSWLRVAPAGGGLAGHGVGALARDGNDLWIGTRGGGLVALLPLDPDAPGAGGPDPTASPEPPPNATPDPQRPITVGLVWRPGKQIYLPMVKREFVPQLLSRGGG